MSVHRVNTLEIIAAFRRLKEAMEIDEHVILAFMKHRESLNNNETVLTTGWGVDMCAPNGKVTPRQKAPNHRRPEKRLRKSK